MDDNSCRLTVEFGAGRAAWLNLLKVSVGEDLKDAGNFDLWLAGWHSRQSDLEPLGIRLDHWCAEPVGRWIRESQSSYNPGLGSDVLRLCDKIKVHLGGHVLIAVFGNYDSIDATIFIVLPVPAGGYRNDARLDACRMPWRGEREFT